jgi:biopolymer transport protein ExbD
MKKLFSIFILLLFISSCESKKDKNVEIISSPSSENIVDEIELEFYLCIYSDETIKINRQQVSLDSLGIVILEHKELANLDSVPKITFIVDKSVKMKLISQIENELRKINTTIMRIKKIVLVLVLLITNYFLFLLPIQYYKIYLLFEKDDFEYATLVDVEYDPDLGVIPQKTFTVKFKNKNYTLYNPAEYWEEVENQNNIKIVYSEEYDEVFYFKANNKIKIEFFSALCLFMVILGCSIYWIFKYNPR